jgi:hypothetical protein
MPGKGWHEMRTLIDFDLDLDTEIVNDPLGDDELSNQPINDEDD